MRAGSLTASRYSLLLVAGAAPSALAGGLSSCPCLTSYPAGVSVDSDGQPTVVIEGVSYPPERHALFRSVPRVC